MKTKALYLTLAIMAQAIWLHAQVVEDIEGNSYKTITYKSKVWMAENLKTTQLNDGTPIVVVEDQKKWESLKTPAVCWYDNYEIVFKSIFGGLYNWYAVNTNKLCPTGWRVPTKAEWEGLINSLGGEDDAGKKLKLKGNLEDANGLWFAYNEDNTNDIKFSALPGGGRFPEMNFNGAFLLGYWWTSSKGEGTDDPNSSYRIDMDYMYPTAFSQITNRNLGLSVRCIKK